MTDTTKQATPVDKTENVQTIIPVSLDAAAFSAASSTATPSNAAASTTSTGANTGEAAAGNAAEEALKKVLEMDDPAGAGTPPVKADGEQSVRDFAKHGTEELEKLLRGEGEPTTAKAAEGEAEPAEGDDGSKQPTIPKARLDEVLDDKRKLKGTVTEQEQEIITLREQAAKDAEEKAYLKGLLEGQKSQQPDGYTSTGGKPVEDKTKEFEADLRTLETDRKAAIVNVATEYENGKITMAQMLERQETINASATELKRRIHQAANEYIAEKTAPKHEDVVKTINADPRLVAATNKLFSDNPWIGQIPPAGAEVLLGLATQAMVKDGVKNEPTVESTWMLRQYMVKVGKELGYDKLAVSGATGGDANKDTKVTQLPTAEQRKAKLELASSLPPSPNLGAGANLPTDAASGIDYQTVGVRELSTMLPKETIGKLLGA